MNELVQYHKDMPKNIVESKQQTYIKAKKSKKKVAASDSDSDSDEDSGGDSLSTEDDARNDSDDDDSGSSEYESNTMNTLSNVRVLSTRELHKPIISRGQNIMESNFDYSEDDSQDSNFEPEESDSDNDDILREDEIDDRIEMAGTEEVELLRNMDKLSIEQLLQYYDYSDTDDDDISSSPTVIISR